MRVESTLLGYICAHEVTTLSYFLFKEQKDKNKVAGIISSLLDIFHVIPIDETILKNSLLSPITDYEDAVIEVSAVAFDIDYILSRNISDFKLSRIPVYTPEQFFLL